MLRDGAFLRFWGGSSISTLGNQVTVLALPWLVLQLTNSPFQLGVVGALEFVPFFLFGLVVGVYADRWDRRVILLAADLVRFARDAAGSVATVATLGNWEHDAGIDRVTAERAYDRAGVKLLYNTATRVRIDGGKAALTVVGIDDPVLGHPDVPRAVRDVRDSDNTIWVLHAPGFVDHVAQGSAPTPAAILSGHTHGGQLRLPFYTPYTPYGSGRFVAGWYRDTLAPLYVSRGIGTVAIRARLFCPPELPIFTLRSGEPGAGSGNS